MTWAYLKGSGMSGKPAAITQAEVKRVIRAAKREGVRQVEVRTRGGASVIIPLCEPDQKPIAADEEISL